MSKVLELIKKQAEFVKGNSAKLSAADHMEAAAKLLRAEVAKPVNLNFGKAIKQDREDRLQKFNANVQTGYTKDLDTHMAGSGWICFHSNEKAGTRSYGNKALPDHKVIVKGGTFSILNKGVVQVSGIHLKDPETLKFISPGKFIKNHKK